MPLLKNRNAQKGEAEPALLSPPHGFALSAGRALLDAKPHGLAQDRSLRGQVASGVI